MTTALHSDVIDAALSCASMLLGMDIVMITSLSPDRFRIERLHGTLPGASEGFDASRLDSFCARMLAGAPRHTDHASTDPAYADAPMRETFGIESYVGVPIHDAVGEVVGTLCGVDSGPVPVTDAAIGVLQELSSIISAHLAAHPHTTLDGVVVRRSGGGWRVGAERTDDLTSAMVLADLLADDLAPGGRPPRPTEGMSEVDRLRLATTQLEHALAARVTVEQAIGVLAERLRTRPRDAFESLRRIARRGGVRVHDLSTEVVRSAVEDVDLPPELARPLR